jgi:hypothetical protein
MYSEPQGLRKQPNPVDQYIIPDEYTPPLPEISLSPEQSLVLRRVREGRSVFFTGSAGLPPLCWIIEDHNNASNRYGKVSPPA